MGAVGFFSNSKVSPYLRSRTIFFCIGFSHFWKEPIHKMLKRLRDRFDIKWLRISMSHHRFPNLRQVFQGDLAAKLVEGVESLDFLERECNCRSRKTSQCDYGGVCRVPIVIYKITCKSTGKIYIGNTQQNFKKRMMGHFQDVRQLIKKDIPSDSYAKHFASLWPPDTVPTPGMQRDMIDCKIVWRGKPLSAVKSFGHSNCFLCNRERMEIIRMSRSNPEKMINSCSEIHGACRHKPQVP